MSRQAAVRAIRQEASRQAGRARTTYRADVVDTRPLKIELAGDVLEVEDDFALTAAVEDYDIDRGIDDGDSLLLMRDDDEWIAFGILPGKLRSRPLAGRLAPLGLRANGVLTDGSDQRIAVQRIIDAAYAQGRDVTHEGGNICCGDTVYNPGLELHFAQPESVMDFSAAPAGRTLIQISGTEDAQRPLVADAAPGASTVLIGPGFETAIAPGDWIRVGSSHLYAGNVATTSGVDQYIGELVLVETVAPGVLTTRWPLDGGPYTMADGAFVTKVALVDGAKVTGRGKIIGGGDAANHRGVQFSRAVNCECTVGFESCVEMGVQFFDCVNFAAERGRAIAGEHNNQLSYSCSIAGACQDGTLANWYARDYRHAITCGGGTSTTRPGINRRITVANVHGIDTHSAAFDCHAGVEDITFHLCKAYRPGYVEGSGGISIRSPWATVTKCSVNSPATYGIWLRNQSEQPTRWIVDDNVVQRTTTEGILATVTLPTVPQTVQSVEQMISICGNELRLIGTDGIHLDGGVASGRLKGAQVCQNEVYGVGANAINLEQCDDVVCNDNIVVGAADSGLRIDDCDDGVAEGNRMAGDLSVGGRGVVFVTNCDGWNVNGNRLSNFEYGVLVGNTCTGCFVTGNHTKGCTIAVNQGSGRGHLCQDNGEYNSIGGASSFTVPAGRVVRVTNNSAINHIKIPADGTMKTLSFASNPTIAHNAAAPPTDYAAVKLNGAANMVASADDTLSLFYNPASGFWEEIGRAVI